MSRKEELINKYKAYIQSFEEPDILDALKKTGREVSDFKYFRDAPILDELFYISSYPRKNTIVYVFVNKKDGSFYTTKKENTKDKVA